MKKPDIVIKDEEHQHEIEARLEKGIVDADTPSIYSTGLKLQNKLIDEQKLIQLLVNSEDYSQINETKENDYQALLKRLKENPDLLLDIIPNSKGKLLNKQRLRDKLKQSQESMKQAFIHKHRINQNDSPSYSAGGYRPSTVGTNVYRNATSKENLDLISNVDHNPPSSVTHYSYKVCGNVYPPSTKSFNPKRKLINQQLANLTKDKILKASDEELNRYMRNMSSVQSNQKGYLAWFPQDVVSPINATQIYKKGRKYKPQNNAIQLASDIFSYYKYPAKIKSKNNSFSVNQPESSFFKDRKRLSAVHAVIPEQIREVQLEDSLANIKVVADSKGDNLLTPNHMNDYSSEVARFSMLNNPSILAQGNLPSLHENLRGTIKSMPRLSHGAIPVAGQFRQRKRRLDINKLTSNLHK